MFYSENNDADINWLWTNSDATVIFTSLNDLFTNNNICFLDSSKVCFPIPVKKFLSSSASMSMSLLLLERCLVFGITSFKSVHIAWKLDLIHVDLLISTCIKFFGIKSFWQFLLLGTLSALFKNLYSCCRCMLCLSTLKFFVYHPVQSLSWGFLGVTMHGAEGPRNYLLTMGAQTSRHERNVSVCTPVWKSASPVPKIRIRALVSICNKLQNANNFVISGSLWR